MSRGATCGLAAPLSPIFRRGAKEAAKQFNHLRDLGVEKGIIDHLTFTPRADKSFKPQAGQLLAYDSLPRGKQVFKFGDRFRAGMQVAKDGQPPVMPQGLQEIGSNLSLGHQRGKVIGRVVCAPRCHDLIQFLVPVLCRLYMTWPVGDHKIMPRSALLRLGCGDHACKKRPKEILSRIALDPALFHTIGKQDEGRRIDGGRGKGDVIRQGGV